MFRSDPTFGDRICELQVGIWSYGFHSWEIWKSQLRLIQDPATAATSINSRTAGWSMLINWWLVASIKHEHALTYMQNLNERWAETFGFERVEKSLTLSLFLMNIHPLHRPPRIPLFSKSVRLGFTLTVNFHVMWPTHPDSLSSSKENAPCRCSPPNDNHNLTENLFVQKVSQAEKIRLHSAPIL